MQKPLVLVDPWPRRRTMIFGEDQWARLEATADVVGNDGDAAMDAATVDAALPRVTAILGYLPAERIGRAPHLRAIINVEGNFPMSTMHQPPRPDNANRSDNRL